MPRTILLGLDGSPLGEDVIELGIAWAKRFDCLIVGLAIVDEPTIRGRPSSRPIRPSYQLAYDMQMSQERRTAGQILQHFAILCSDAQVAHKLLEDEGNPTQRIVEEAKRYDLVMLGQKTYFHAGHHGTPCETLEQVLRATPRPVVVVSRGVVADDAPSAGLAVTEKEAGVLVAYDGSLQASRTLQAFAHSGLSALGPIRVLTVHPKSSLESARVADHAVEFLEFHEIHATRSTIVSPQNPGLVILEEAKRLGSSLIVMGAHGQPKLQEFFFGSATCAAINAVNGIPLFLFH